MKEKRIDSGIPAKVRACKGLDHNAKLLYKEIYDRSTDQGYCLVENNFFAELFQVDKRTISNWVYLLQKEGFIASQILKENDKTLTSYKLLFPI